MTLVFKEIVEKPNNVRINVYYMSKTVYFFYFSTITGKSFSKVELKLKHNLYRILLSRKEGPTNMNESGFKRISFPLISKQ